ncbi:MAG TPA: transcriptional regulator [Pseudonocardiaceae bacterium]|jgi:DNA-binding HxlR family transcriptional regulator|nr:transcriptional regulator [Pseudonocardiaceae bacterium]
MIDGALPDSAGNPGPAASADPRPALPELDAVIHAQARLRVTVALAGLAPGDQIAFPTLQRLLEMTPGNLSTHLRKLEDAEYVEITKTHQRRTPVTYVALTRRGRRAFEDYTANLRALLATTGIESAGGDLG